MRNLIYLSFSFILVSAILFSCSKDKGIDPNQAFSDKGLLDSCKNTLAFSYYYNKPDSVYTGAHGPHGSFKLKFNKIAYAALTASGKLPIGSKFPNGSMIVKEVVSGNGISLYALMYKRNNSWLWAEIEPGGKVLFSVNKESSTCTSCHSQAGNRDLVDSFNFY